MDEGSKCICYGCDEEVVASLEESAIYTTGGWWHPRCWKTRKKVTRPADQFFKRALKCAIAPLVRVG